MKHKGFFKGVIVPSGLCTMVLVILCYNFSFKGRPPLTNEELPGAIVLFFIFFFVLWGWEYLKKHS